MIVSGRSRSVRSVIITVGQYSQSAPVITTSEYSEDISLTSQPTPSRKELSKIPGPSGVWKLGTSPYYWLGKGNYSVSGYLKTLQHLNEKYGDVVREDRLDGTIIHLYNADDIKTVYRHEGKWPEVVPLAPTTLEFRKGEEMSLGLGNVNGEEWFKLRHKVRFFSKVKNVEKFFLKPTDTVLNRFIANLQRKAFDNGGIVNNFHKEIERWNLETSAMVIFEKHLGLLTANPPRRYIRFIQNVLDHAMLNSAIQFESVKIHSYLNTNKWKKLIELEEYRNRIITDLLSDAIREMSHCIDDGILEPKRFTFLRRLIQQRDKTDEEVVRGVECLKSKEYDDLLILALSVFGDGLITTSPMATCLIYNFATNPEIQERCYREISTSIGSTEKIEPAMLAEVPYLKACLKESMRLFPNNTEVIRILNEDVVLSGWDIPAGTVLHNNTFASLRSPTKFREPNKFIPERWMRGSQEDVHPFLHLPFSHGTRQCAGRRVALQDLLCLTTKLIQNFKLEWCSDSELRMVYQTLQAIREPIRVRLMPRD